LGVAGNVYWKGYAQDANLCRTRGDLCIVCPKSWIRPNFEHM
jgi:hypothetical protein